VNTYEIEGHKVISYLRGLNDRTDASGSVTPVQEAKASDPAGALQPWRDWAAHRPGDRRQDTDGALAILIAGILIGGLLVAPLWSAIIEWLPGGRP
jgi:hypothetical protein